VCSSDLNWRGGGGYGTSDRDRSYRSGNWGGSGGEDWRGSGTYGSSGNYGGSGSYGRDVGTFGGDFDSNTGGYGGSAGGGFGADYERAGSRGGYSRGGSGAGYRGEDWNRGGDYSRSRDYGSGSRNDDRGWFDRASDEVSSWFGDEEAARRRQQDQHRGRGPKGYTRSDDRIREDVSDRLTDDWRVDASDIEVSVSGGEITLSGTVDSRDAKRRAEDVVESVPGVSHVQNNLRLRQSSGSSSMSGTGATSASTSGSIGSSGGAVGSPATAGSSSSRTGSSGSMTGGGSSVAPAGGTASTTGGTGTNVSQTASGRSGRKTGS